MLSVPEYLEKDYQGIKAYRRVDKLDRRKWQLYDEVCLCVCACSCARGASVAAFRCSARHAASSAIPPSLSSLALHLYPLPLNRCRLHCLPLPGKTHGTILSNGPEKAKTSATIVSSCWQVAEGPRGVCSTSELQRENGYC